MIAPGRIALLKDAYYQVMDNWVFRILAVICAIFILIPFVIGLRENGIVVAFGLWEWSYAEVMDKFGGPGGSSFRSDDIRGQAIALYMQLVVDQIVGNFGVIFSIAATSFFVPQMLEKGAADVLFHKPLGRLSFYLSRYFAGVLFVAILSSVLAAGTYLGFLLNSSHNDPGILMGAPLLTYVFALVFSVAMLIGVLTRSTVASILLTCIFFVLNGCVHSFWVGKTEIDMQLARAGAPSILSSGRDVKAERGEDRASDASQAGAGESSEADAGDPLEPEEKEQPILDILWNVLCGIHYVLPKTSDADVIAKKLRSAINAPPFREPGSLLSLQHVPEGMQLLEANQGKAPAEFSDAESILLGEPRFVLQKTEPESRQSYTLFRRKPVLSEFTHRGRVRSSIENASKASTTLQEALEVRLAASGSDAEAGADNAIARKSKGFGNQGLGAISSYVLSWTSLAGEGRQAIVFRVGNDWVYTLIIEDDNFEQSEERAAAVLEPVGKELGFDSSVGAYEEAFRMDAPWRYNSLFSVGSSLAFVLLVLAIGWWRLMRIDF